MNNLERSAQELIDLEREMLRLFMAGHVDQAMDDNLTEWAIVCPPGMERIVGRENQKAMFKQLLAMEGVELSWDPVEAFVGPSNDMGFVYGSVKWRMPEENEQQGKYISVWVKEDGKWRNAAEIRNSNS